MATALAKPTGTALAKPSSNPFRTIANMVKPHNIYGQLLKYNKGVWQAGEHATVIPMGTHLVAIMDKLCTGYIRWEDHRPAEQRMVVAGEGTPPTRPELGYHDQSRWELDNNNQPRDPWQATMYLPMISEDGKPYTLAVNSDGGRRAVGGLSGEYADQYDAGKAVYPIVSLGSDSYMHSKKSRGRILIPVLSVVEWVPASKYERQIMAALQGGLSSGRSDDESENPGDGMDFDDEIPF